jgi:hypothetical protein
MKEANQKERKDQKPEKRKKKNQKTRKTIFWPEKAEKGDPTETQNRE